ncbi:hypothetical protein SAMN04487914_10870 [Arthrobacter sp. ok909]|uniref:hypothetical protein n=1 Tax=Arthrobacter sp. ok909 TaxID=1761746 RepID=UPI00089021FD|nr:hypothetical protein [Arthrobacter sp. ok909]SDP32863.1 hypothetical protein SAMN04487914_10870 [Arthrobacter sp. ok909]
MDIDKATDELVELANELHDKSSQPHAQAEAKQLALTLFIEAANVYGWYANGACNGPD